MFSMSDEARQGNSRKGLSSKMAMMDKRILDCISDAVYDDLFVSRASGAEVFGDRFLDTFDSAVWLYVPELEQILMDYKGFTLEMFNDAFEKIFSSAIRGYAQELADGMLSYDDLLWITEGLHLYVEPPRPSDIINYFDHLVEKMR